MISEKVISKVSLKTWKVWSYIEASAPWMSPVFHFSVSVWPCSYHLLSKILVTLPTSLLDELVVENSTLLHDCDGFPTHPALPTPSQILCWKYFSLTKVSIRWSIQHTMCIHTLAVGKSICNSLPRLKCGWVREQIAGEGRGDLRMSVGALCHWGRALTWRHLLSGSCTVGTAARGPKFNSSHFSLTLYIH